MIEALSETSPTRKTLNRQGGSNRELVDAHNIVIKAEIDNKEKLHEKLGDEWGDKWAESWLEKEDKEYEFNEETNQYTTKIKGFEVRFTENFVRVVLGSYNGLHVERVKDRLMVEARSSLELIEGETPVEFDTRFGTPMFTVNTQHLALVRDVFAELVVECDETDLRDFHVYDEDGRIRLWVDDSEGERHLEAGENSRFEEEDLHFIRDEVYRRMILNKDSWRDMMDFIEGFEDFEELESLPDDMDTMKTGINFLIWKEIKGGREKTKDMSKKNSVCSKREKGYGSETLKGLKYLSEDDRMAVREEGLGAVSLLRLIEYKLKYTILDRWFG